MWFIAFLPVLLAAIGALWIALRRPSDATIGAIQHFAAGVMFYGAAGELLPDITRQGLIAPLIIGGLLGIACMLLLKRFADSVTSAGGLIGAAMMDALIDGLVLGIAMRAGERGGLLLGIALAIEFLFLGLVIAAAFDDDSPPLKIIAITFTVALTLPVGAWLATPLSTLAVSFRIAALAFGLVAVLYLVTEELLVEAHEKPETPPATALFFIGFLALTVLGELIDKR